MRLRDCIQTLNKRVDSFFKWARLRENRARLYRARFQRRLGADMKLEERILLNGSPEFTPDTWTIDLPEDTAPGIVANAVASDPEGDPIDYSILMTDGPFSIDASTGDISLDGPLDFESMSMHTIDVSAMDDSFNEGYAWITVNVLDVAEPPSDVPSVDDIYLMNDTGVDGTDEITSDPELGGMLSWESPDFTGFTVEFDHHDDGSIDGTASVSVNDGMLSYNPLANEAALNTWEGPFTLRYRAIGHSSGGDVASSWSNFTFTLDRVGPVVTQFTPDDGENFDPTGPGISVTFSEDLDANSVDISTVWIENANTSEQPMSQMPTANGSVVDISVDVLELTPDDYTTFVDGVIDLAGNAIAPSDSVTWTVTSPPVFVDEFGDPTDQYYFYPALGTTIGDIVGQAIVVDPDTALSALTFTILPTGDYLDFSIDSSGNIIAQTTMSVCQTYNLDIQVEDDTNNTDQASVTVDSIDLNLPPVALPDGPYEILTSESELIVSSTDG